MRTMCLCVCYYLIFRITSIVMIMKYHVQQQTVQLVIGCLLIVMALASGKGEGDAVPAEDQARVVAPKAAETSTRD